MRLPRRQAAPTSSYASPGDPTVVCLVQLGQLGTEKLSHAGLCSRWPVLKEQAPAEEGRCSEACVRGPASSGQGS